MSQSELREGNRGMAQQRDLRRPYQPVDVLPVPARPTLAPKVQLVGELQESGFQDSQWLIRRDGQFIQVTELLYRVAEQANGERTLEELAAEVTKSTDWIVTTEHVRALIRKLIPLGLIALSDNSATPGTEAVNRNQKFSPLMLNMRMRMLSPQLLDPVTNLLQHLYRPLILISVLLITMVAHGWLYFVHGVTDSIVEILYAPRLLISVLAILLIADFFHELGHASALRYGGGRVGGIGVGFYLVYPAFYTDTTDNYRLDRWARVRTDLGGFYFHLIFALSTIGLYLLSGQEFLLFVVVLINMAIMYQLLPFVRFDGYWALADLTGIPDFFSQMGPFVASILPGSSWKGSKLPDLKPWVKVVFVLYMVLTIPVLALLLFLAVIRLPDLIAIVQDSFFIQAAQFSQAYDHGNFLGMLGSVAQMLILALPLLGIMYLLYRTARRVVGALVDWSRPMPVRRTVGVLVAAGAIVVLGALLLLRSPFGRAAVPTGVQTFEVTERTHVETPVDYAQTPPVGGDHAPIWQNCGFYDTPIANENAVHAMEHGAVWITYRPDLAPEQVDVLRQLAQRQSHILVSPFPDLPAPVVASAWGHQLRLDSTDDPRLDEFVRAFRLGPQAPERGGPCAEGVGTPK